MKSRNTALCGLLLALSAGISAAESLIPLPLGVKPGFSNLPVMYSMAEQGAKYGFASRCFRLQSGHDNFRMYCRSRYRSCSKAAA